MERHYTVTEAAYQLDVSSQRVGQIIKEGNLRVVRYGPTKNWIRITESALRNCAELYGKTLRCDFEKVNTKYREEEQ